MISFFLFVAYNLLFPYIINLYLEMKFVYYLFVIFQAGWLLVSASPVEFDLLMPNVAPKTRDMYLCHKMKLDQANPVYITEFEAKASSGVAHHILLYGCAGVSDEETWDCGEMSSTTAGSEYKTGPVCKGGSNIVFAWALDAPKLHLPDNVAFKLGGDSGINYLVLQVHYANVDKFISKTLSLISHSILFIYLI